MSDPQEKTPTGPPTLTPFQQDEMTIKQTEEIEREITEANPLISLIPLDLLHELLPIYKDDEIYTKKIKEISKTWSKIRRTRPDGNCFYRAVLWRVFEACLTNPSFKNKLDEKYKEFKQLLTESGYTQFTVEDFYDNFGEALSQLSDLKTTDSLISTHFTNAPVCDYLTVFLRILTAAELTKNQSFYGNFLEAIDMTEFIKTEVEPMGKEADHLQIIALSTALNVGIKVVHMDRGDGVVVHTFPEEGIENYDVVLLYRPGHYDVIYE